MINIKRLSNHVEKKGIMSESVNHSSNRHFVFDYFTLSIEGKLVVIMEAFLHIGILKIKVVNLLNTSGHLFKYDRSILFPEETLSAFLFQRLSSLDMVILKLH